METRRQHFVEFLSPGTFFDETTTRPVESWDVKTESDETAPAKGTKLVWCKNQYWTLTGERSIGGSWLATNDTTGGRGSFSDSMFAMDCCVFLGGPTHASPGERERPAPAKGQRWRTPKASSLWGLTPEAVFELNGRNEAIECWTGRGPAINGEMLNEWNMCDDWFKPGGALEFVDHGSPSTTAPMPGTHTCKHGRVGYCTECTPPAPSPLTARQILTARQRDRDRVRAETAEAVSALCSEYELLPDADDGRGWRR